MADEASNIPTPFDVRTIRHLIRLMARYQLNEIDLQEGDLRIRLRRGTASVAMPSPAPLPTPLPVAATSPPPPPPPAEPEKAEKRYLTIKSPTPGTFYISPSPDAPPFVQVGSRVTPTTVVCIIEAMKIFNEIQAECTGVIAEVLVQNGQPVEYGQVLFKVEPTLS